MKEAAIDIGVAIGSLYNSVRKNKPIKNYKFIIKEKI